jgi:hypothetical protein
MKNTHYARYAESTKTVASHELRALARIHKNRANAAFCQRLSAHEACKLLGKRSQNAALHKCTLRIKKAVNGLSCTRLASHRRPPSCLLFADSTG